MHEQEGRRTYLNLFCFKLRPFAFQNCIPLTNINRCYRETVEGRGKSRRKEWGSSNGNIQYHELWRPPSQWSKVNRSVPLAFRQTAKQPGEGGTGMAARRGPWLGQFTQEGSSAPFWLAHSSSLSPSLCVCVLSYFLQLLIVRTASL